MGFRNRTNWPRMGAVACVASSLLMGCGKDSDVSTKAGPPPPVVGIERVEPQDFARWLPLTGTVEPTTVAILSTAAEGPVERIAVREGDTVRAGAVLVEIGRAASTRAQEAAALEELARLEQDYQRIERLVKTQAVAREQLDAVRAGLERARAQLALARQASADFVIRAPWDGIVARVHVAEGRYLAPRTALVELFDPQSLMLRFMVPEQEAFAIAVGDRVEASFDAIPDKHWNLELARAWPELDRRLRMRTFEAALPLQQAAFAPGQFARVRIKIAEASAALTVSEDAIMADPIDGSLSVWAIDADNKARRAVITTGFASEGRRWVRSGLMPGDQIVVEGGGSLRQGQPVRIAQPQNTKAPKAAQ